MHFTWLIAVVAATVGCANAAPVPVGSSWSGKRMVQQQAFDFYVNDLRWWFTQGGGYISADWSLAEEAIWQEIQEILEADGYTGDADGSRKILPEEVRLKDKPRSAEELEAIVKKTRKKLGLSEDTPAVRLTSTDSSPPRQNNDRFQRFQLSTADKLGGLVNSFRRAAGAAYRPNLGVSGGAVRSPSTGFLSLAAGA